MASYGGCKINLTVKNTSNSNIVISNPNLQGSFQYTSVRIKNGGWKSLSSGTWMRGQSSIQLKPGRRASDTYAAVFGCNLKRQYRVRYHCPNGSEFTKYYPSSSKWTKRQTLRINIGKLCN